MGLLSSIRSAQSRNVVEHSSTEVLRKCPCGAHLRVDATGEGVSGARPSGLLMSAEDLRDAARSARSSAARNAVRNAHWARCPECGRRGDLAWPLAMLSRLLVLLPAGVVGAIVGCVTGMVRDTVDPNNMVETAVAWGAGTGALALAFATWRRLRQADGSVMFERS